MQSNDRALKQAQSNDDISSMPRPNGGPILVSYTSSNLGTRQAMQALLDGLPPGEPKPNGCGAPRGCTGRSLKQYRKTRILWA